jgi:hypothetical protein
MFGYITALRVYGSSRVGYLATDIARHHFQFGKWRSCGRWCGEDFG